VDGYLWAWMHVRIRVHVLELMPKRVDVCLCVHTQTCTIYVQIDM
jgi:hypothetical protein